MRNPTLAIAVLSALAVVPFASGCSDESEAQCVRSGDAKVCYVRENAAAGNLEVSGLQPGSTLTLTSDELGESTYPVNDSGTVDGKVGVLNSTGAPIEVTVTGTTASNESLVGTFDS
jgi:hypothetical protein